MLCTDICMQHIVKLELEDQTLSTKESDGLNLPGNNQNSISSKKCIISAWVKPLCSNGCVCTCKAINFMMFETMRPKR